MISAFGVDHGEVSKGLINTSMKMAGGMAGRAKMTGNSFSRGTKAGVGGWKESGGRSTQMGMKAGQVGNYALRNKKTIGAVGGAALAS